MKKTILLFAAITFLCGCSQKWWAGKCFQHGICKTLKDSTVIVKKDSTYLVPIPYTINADTAWMQMLLECDSTGNVWMKQAETWQGKYIEIKRLLYQNTLTVTATHPEVEDTAYKPVTNTSTETTHDELQQAPPTNILTWGQRFKCNAFWPLSALCFVLICLVVVYIIYRVKRRA